MSNLLNIPGMDFVDTLEKIKSFSNPEKEVYLPMLKTTVNVSEIASEQEIAMLESKIAPYQFDAKLTELMYSKVNYDNVKDEYIKTQFSTYEGFASILSNIDKEAIELGVLSASYDKLSDREVECECGEKTFFEPIISNLIQTDTYGSVWDKEMPIYEWGHKFNIELSPGFVLEFTSRFSFSKSLNDVIRVANMDKEHAELLKEYGILHTVQDAFISMIKQIKIVSSDDAENVTYTDIFKIAKIVNGVPLKFKQRIIEELAVTSGLGDYSAKYYDICPCGVCGSNINVIVESPIKELLSRTMGLI